MLLELHDVHVHYGKVEALKGISLTVDQGEIVTLIGGNGAGKSTTLKTISGLRPVTSGTIEFEGRSVVGTPAHKLVERGLSHAPEGRGIFPGMTVLENLEMGAYARKGGRSVVTDELARVF
jgi:branched-chain amino acid transport system ATP-binding protein